MEKQEVSRPQRLSARRKGEVVIALLKGGDAVELAREYGISQAELYGWRDRFLEGGQEALKTRRNGLEAARERKVARLERKIGEMAIEAEILREAARLKKKLRLD